MFITNKLMGLHKVEMSVMLPGKGRVDNKT